MKIAFISYEYPPDTADGGIATYVHQAAAMLQARGHHVEVFSGSRTRTHSGEENGILTHRFLSTENEDFAHAAGEAFADRHRTVGFDVLEGPDFSADAREAVRRVPRIPLVLKLHTPSIILLWLNYYERRFSRRLALWWKARRAGRKCAWGYDPSINNHREHVRKTNLVERAHALEADEIASPSQSLGAMLIREWGLDPGLVHQVPYPYTPSPALLEIPAQTRTNCITYLGRLETRKGVVDLARAIPAVLRRHPGVRFRFVGPTDESPRPGMDMAQYLQELLKSHSESVEFTGGVPPSRIPEIMSQTDIAVFPSLWENFPCVCLEAMAAARAIVGSSAGGMLEMLDHGRAGRVVAPGSPRGLATALIELLDSTERRVALGETARARLNREYTADRIGQVQEASYQRAIQRRQTLGRRSTPRS